jgi:very-short-patch-repair endonuclease
MASKSIHPGSGLVWRLANRQHGVVTRSQLLDAGLTSAAVKHRLETGRLHPLGRGVYAVGRPQVSREGRWLAAVLACGPLALLSHASAAHLWRIRVAADGPPIHVSVPTEVRRAHPGIRVHRSAVPAVDVTVHDGVPVVSPARVLLHQATALTESQLERDLNVADALGLVPFERLRERLDDFAREPGAARLRALVERHTLTLTDSELETRFLPLTRAAGLAAPQTRRQVNGFRVDFFWPALGLVVETDGLRYHRTPVQQARDLLREQTHKAAGTEALRFTHRQVVHEPRWVVATLRRVASRLAA